MHTAHLTLRDTQQCCHFKYWFNSNTQHAKKGKSQAHYWIIICKLPQNGPGSKWVYPWGRSWAALVLVLVLAVEQHSPPPALLNRRKLQSSAFQIPKHTEVQNCTNKNNPQSSAEQENDFIFPVEKCFHTCLAEKYINERSEKHISAQSLYLRLNQCNHRSLWCWRWQWWWWWWQWWWWWWWWWIWWWWWWGWIWW